MDVRILGPLEVYGPDGRIDLGLRKARLLFATLALRAGVPVSIDQLAEVLWPIALPNAWEATVHAHVSRLRRALDPTRTRSDGSRIETLGQAYALRLEDGELDVQRFEQLAGAGRVALARGDTAAATELLRDALLQWRGPVLSDFAEESSVAAEARRLDELRLVTVVQHLEAELASGREAAVVGELETLVQEHPLREELWQLLMLALYRSGRQADALRRYANVRRILVEELGIEPGPALRSLEQAILEHDPALKQTGVTVALRPPAEPGAIPVWLAAPGDAFVGRQSQRDAILRATPERTGERRLVVVSGEPGVGKTRLIREVATVLQAAGASVLGGRCVEEPLHAFQPFAEAVERLSVVDSALDPAMTVLAANAPDVDPSSLPIHDAEAMQYALFRALTQTLTERRLGGAPVLVLDDVHWASSEALQVLAHVLRDDDQGSLLVLATARDTEVNDALDALVAELARDDRVQKIPLANLNADEVRELLEERGNDAGPDVLFELTEGNPFYVEQMLRHVAESGGELAASTIPDSVRDTIARRLLRLPAETRRLLGIAAVVGQEFSLPVLAGAGEYTLDAADDLLGPALGARIVTEQTGRVGSYAFTHGLIRHALRDGLGAARAARVHRGVAMALESLPGSDGYALDIAFHHLSAAADGSDPFAGVRCARIGAARARTGFAFADAVTVLSRAVEVLDASPHEIDRAVLCETLTDLALAQAGVGLDSKRAESLERAFALSAEAAIEVRARVLFEAFSATTQPSAAWTERVRTVCEQLEENSELHVMTTAFLAFAEAAMPGEHARDLARSALGRLESVSPTVRADVLLVTSLPLQAWQTPSEEIAHAQAAVAAAIAVGEPAAHAAALGVLRQAYLAAGDLDRSDAVAVEYERIALELRIPRYLAGVEQRRAMRALLAGRFAAAEAHAEQAVTLQPTSEYLEGLAVQLFALRFEQGRLDEVRGAVSEWAATDTRPAWRLGEAMLLAEIGELDAARSALAPFIASRFDTVPRDSLWFASLACAARAAETLSDASSAVLVADLLTPAADRVIVLGQGAVCWGSVHRLLGPLAALLGERDAAVSHYRAAADVHERLGALPFLARDRLDLARILLRGDRAERVEAVELARTGEALARSLGQESLVARHAELSGST